MVEYTDKKKELNSTSIDVVFEKHKKVRNQKRFLTHKMKIFIFGILTGLILLIAGFLLSDFSKVRGFKIEGNQNLSDEQILVLSGLDSNSRFLFIFNQLTESSIESSPLVQEAKVHVQSDGTVHIQVVEKKIVGYRYYKVPEIIFTDGSIVEMKNDELYLLSRIPIVVGFDELIDSEELQKTYMQWLQGFDQLEPSRIARISEIHRYEYSYDSYGMELIMKDGNRVFTTMNSLNVLNRYNGLASAVSEKGSCIYIDEHSKNAYQSVCPEDIVQPEENPDELENPENPDKSDE